VEIRVGADQALDAYVAAPARSSAPAVVVLHEIFGITPSIKAAADGLAAAGFLAVVPDLFWRQAKGVVLSETDDADRARGMALGQGLAGPQVIEDIAAVAAHVRALQACNGQVGAVGFCLGGRLAFLAACAGAVDAAAAYYPTGLQTVLDAAGALARPVLLQIAEEDALCPPEAQAAIHARLGGHPQVTLKTYPGVGHAFARPGSPARDPAMADLANATVAAFLRAQLADA
jgi:carboxymethylenebutenolidase